MLSVSVPAVTAQEIPHLAVLIMAAVAAGALVRVVLCILAAFAVRKALSDTGEDAVAIRAHRLAVLQMILDALAMTSLFTSMRRALVRRRPPRALRKSTLPHQHG